MSKYIMSIDQGTTSSRVCLFNHDGNLVAQSSKEFPQIFPKPGWVEHRPDDIWNSVKWCVTDVLKKTKISAFDILSIGITNQRETVILWDSETNKAIYNAIVWQCRRTSVQCEKYKKQKKEKWINQKTGLLLDPYFSGTKIQWILKNIPHSKKLLAKKTLKAGTVDSFLLWNLTGGKAHKTDVSNASRTLLMNLKSLKWDKEILKFFKIPDRILPEICDSNSLFGKTSGLSFLPDGIPIHGMAGDQQAALFGQSCFNVGEAKCTFGTGSFMLLNTGSQRILSKSKMLTTVAWKLKNERAIYALEGGAFICGAAVQWLRDGLGIISTSQEIEELANKVTDSGGVEFVPALTGLGAPYWKSEVRGIISGLTRGTNQAHIARATLEALALQNAEVLLSMQKDLKKKIKLIKVDGGAAQNDLLIQLQADYLGINIERSKTLETTALGAAYMAGIGVGFWKNTDEIKKLKSKESKFKTKISKQQRTERMTRWKLAIQQCLVGRYGK